MTNKEIIETLQEFFPKFSKVSLSMTQHSDDYGVVLCPKARKLLKAKEEKPVCVADTPSRKQITLRIETPLYEQLVSLMDLTGSKTVNDLVTFIIAERLKGDANDTIRRSEGAVPHGGEDTA